MTPYQREEERLAAELPANDSARLAYYKRRAPLGDAEFYRHVCGPVMPADILAELDTMIGQMSLVFQGKGNLNRFKAPLRDLMRRFRLSVPPPRRANDLYVRPIPGPFCQQSEWYYRCPRPTMRQLHESGR